MLELIREIEALSARLRALEQTEYPVSTGTFTPTFGGSTTNGTITHTASTGVYQRVGGWCHFSLRITISTIAVAPTGDLVINGLPFTSGNTIIYPGVLAIGFLNQITLLAATRFVGANIGSAVTRINLTESPSAGGSTNIPATALAANAWAVIGGAYEIA